jgi:hypothetical protein
MRSRNERTAAGQPLQPATPLKRFRLKRLEERIAPKCFFNKQSKQVGDCPQASGGSSSGGVY